MINITILFHATTDFVPSSVHSSSEEYNSYNVPGVFIITGTIVGTALILLNVLLIGFCLHRRTNKRIRGVMVMLFVVSVFRCTCRFSGGSKFLQVPLELIRSSYFECSSSIYFFKLNDH